MSLVIGTNGDPMAAAPAVRTEIRAVDPNQPLTEIRSLDDAIRSATAEVSVAAAWVMALGGIALILAAVCIYGQLCYYDIQRTPEVSIRLALRAHPAHHVGQMLAERAMPGA